MFMLAILIVFHSQVIYVHRDPSYYRLPISFAILVFSFDRGVLGQMLSGRFFVFFVVNIAAKNTNDGALREKREKLIKKISIFLKFLKIIIKGPYQINK